MPLSRWKARRKLLPEKNHPSLTRRPQDRAQQLLTFPLQSPRPTPNHPRWAASLSPILPSSSHPREPSLAPQNPVRTMSFWLQLSTNSTWCSGHSAGAWGNITWGKWALLGFFTVTCLKDGPLSMRKFTSEPDTTIPTIPHAFLQCDFLPFLLSRDGVHILLLSPAWSYDFLNQ